MDDDYEVMYLDDDERNAVVSATRTQSRHTHSGGGRPVPSFLGGSRRPQVVRRSPSSGRYYDGRPRQIVVQQAPRRGFGGLNTGELIEMAAFILAAIQPLPAAPTGQGHTETDVENLVIYQTALATHAKRDEQLRTLGGLLARLLK